MSAIASGSDLPRRTAHPGRAPFGGYVYVIECSNGIVKVGSTRDARKRITNHRRACTGFGISISQAWTSIPLYAYKDAEDRLIAETVKVGTVARPREWFTNIRFSAVVGLAEAAQVAAAEAADSRVFSGHLGTVIAKEHFGGWRKFVAACESGKQEHVVYDGRPSLTHNQLLALTERKRGAA